MTNIIGLYDDPGMVRQVINELVNAGLHQEDIEVMGGDARSDQDLEQHIAELGVESRNAHAYAEAVRHGKAVLNARTSDEQADRVLEILNRNGARNIQDVAEELERQGGQQTRQAQGRQQQGENEQTEAISEVEEQMRVEKRQTLQGGMRVKTTVSEQPVEETVRLKEEKIDVERKESERKLSPDEAEAAFKGETRDFHETREVPEVKKEARETGRIEVRKTTEEHEEKVKDKVRKSKVETEKIEPENRDKKQ